MDMYLTLHREQSWGGATISRLMHESEFICDILEDTVREIPGRPVSEWKVYGETAIPCGVYDIVLVNSPKFGLNTMHLAHVDGFSDVHIHGGNTAANTLGCLLTGTRSSRNTVQNSQKALSYLRTMVMGALQEGGKVQLEIIPAPEY